MTKTCKWRQRTHFDNYSNVITYTECACAPCGAYACDVLILIACCNDVAI